MKNLHHRQHNYGNNPKHASKSCASTNRLREIEKKGLGFIYPAGTTDSFKLITKIAYLTSQVWTNSVFYKRTALKINFAQKK